MKIEEKIMLDKNTKIKMVFDTNVYGIIPVIEMTFDKRFRHFDGIVEQVKIKGNKTIFVNSLDGRPIFDIINKRTNEVIDRLKKELFFDTLIETLNGVTIADILRGGKVSLRMEEGLMTQNFKLLKKDYKKEENVMTLYMISGDQVHKEVDNYDELYKDLELEIQNHNATYLMHKKVKNFKFVVLRKLRADRNKEIYFNKSSIIKMIGGQRLRNKYLDGHRESVEKFEMEYAKLPQELADKAVLEAKEQFLEALQQCPLEDLNL